MDLHKLKGKNICIGNSMICLLIWGYQEVSCGAARLRDMSVRGGEGRKEAMPASCYMSSCSLL